MPVNAKRGLLWTMIVTLLVIACPPTRGCAEASFRLSPESRLPKWFASAGVPRDEAIVTMDYYSGPLGRTARFIVRDGNGRMVAAVVGQTAGDSPRTVGAEAYPSYEIVTVDGMTEVIEHRRRGPIFYVTDDVDEKQKLGVQ